MQARGVVSKRAKIAASIVVALALGDCTAFNDLEVDPTYLDSIDEAAAVCTKLASCSGDKLAEAVERSIGVPVSDDNFSVCMTWLTAPLPTNRIGVDAQRALIECLVANAGSDKSCTDLAGCMYVRPITDVAGDCKEVTDKCEGEAIAVDCHQNLRFKCDSPRFGDRTVCIVGAQGHAGCSLGGCFQSEVVPSCDDGTTDTCDDASRLRVDEVCSTEGLACSVVTGSNGAPAATCGADEACTDAPGSARCSSENADVEACDGDVKSTFNCSGVGLACIEDATTSHAVCGASTDLCKPFDASIDTCSGDTLNACVAGQLTAIDCRKYGASCKAIAGGRSGCAE